MGLFNKLRRHAAVARGDFAMLADNFKIPPLPAAVNRLIGELKRTGPERLLEKSYPAVPPELRECVFANACDVVLSDGVVEQDEKDFIDSLQTKLEIDAKRAKTIVQVMVYKNHG